MSIKQLNPYINFDGTAEKAIQLYQTALGAHTEFLMRFSDAPGENVPAEHKDLIMHACLRLGEATLLLSDGRPGCPVPAGQNIQVALHFSDPGEMAKAFDALAVGGKVALPIHDAFWGAKFGMLTDAFGIGWMFNCQVGQA